MISSKFFFKQDYKGIKKEKKKKKMHLSFNWKRKSRLFFIFLTLVRLCLHHV
jgi:hypothetical protein